MIENNSINYKKEKFIFTGKAGEYFKIWIVNMILSILSLGIYSAWAKVRKKRYFYGNTTLAGGRFTYLAQPMQILKGRLLAVGVLFAAGAVIQIEPLAEPIFTVLFLLILPFLFVSAVRFNAQNSAYQHIRFQYKASYRQALVVFILYGLLTFITLGLAYPLFARARQNLLIAEHQYGQLEFQFGATAGQFYGEYFRAYMLFILVFILYIASLAFVVKQFADPKLFSSMIDFEQFFSEQAEGEYSDESPQLQIDPAPEAANPDDADIIDPSVDNETAPDMTTSSDPDKCACEPNEEQIKLLEAISGFASSIVFSIYVLFFFIYVHISVRIANLSLNHSYIGQHRLKSELETLPLFFIYLSNIFGILLSFGLLIPWAQIRLARYRLNCISLLATGDLQAVVAQEQEKLSATGEEFGDFMDIDIGI